MTRAVLLALIAVAVFIGLNSIYILNPDQQAIVLRVGQWVRSVNPPGVNEPGLKFKAPLFENVVIYSKRNLSMPLSVPETVASDQERLEVDVFVRWRIVNPRVFYQAARSQSGGEARLRAFTEDAVRNTLGDANTNQIIAERRVELMRAVTRDLNIATSREMGVEVLDVRMRKVDLPTATRDSVYGRMATERQQEAGRYRAEGEGEAQRIRAEADRLVTEIRATAQGESERIQGQGDAERARIFARAYGKDAEFAAFYRSMRSYDAALTNNTPIVIPPDSDFFRYMQRRDGGARR